MVSGGGSLERAGVLARARESLASAGVEFDEHPGVLTEPDLATVELLRGRLREGFDLAVSIGGGSVIDAAKAAAGLANERAPAREYYDGRKIAARGIPHVAIPSTAGTGAEATPNAVITDPERPGKTSIRGPWLLPDAAVVDPEILLGLPPRVTAESGLDALTQAIESYVSTHATPLTEGLSLHAVGLLAEGLVRSAESPADIDGRTACAYGSLMAGVALANARLGVVHGLAHPLGARLGLAHGLICGVLLAPSIRLNEPACPAKYARVAKALADGFSAAGTRGITAAGIPRERVGYSRSAAARLHSVGQGEDRRPAETERRSRAADLIEALMDLIEIPRKLPVAIAEKDVALIVAESMPSGSLKANPLRIEPAHVEKLLREVLPA